MKKQNDIQDVDYSTYIYGLNNGKRHYCSKVINVYKTYYIIFDDKLDVLNFTSDYFYFKRLVRKYRNKQLIITRSISNFELLENSTEEKSCSRS